MLANHTRLSPTSENESYVLKSSSTTEKSQVLRIFWIAVVLGKFRSIHEPSIDVKIFRPILHPSIDVKRI